MPRYMEVLLAAGLVVGIVTGVVFIGSRVSANCIDLGFYKSCGVSTIR